MNSWEQASKEEKDAESEFVMRDEETYIKRDQSMELSSSGT